MKCRSSLGGRYILPGIVATIVNIVLASGAGESGWTQTPEAVAVVETGTTVFARIGSLAGPERRGA